MRQEKQLLLDEIKTQIEQFGSFVLMRYFKLSANAANEFRGTIAKLGGDIQVVRKRVFLKAADECGISLKMSDVEGHVGLVFAGHDALETTKAVFKFSQEGEKAIQVIGGRFDGEIYDARSMEALSKLPGKDEMRAQLLATLEAPLSQTLATMDALVSSVVYCLDNKCKQENAE